MSTRLYLCPIDFNRAITLGRRGRWFDSIPIYNTVTSKVAGVSMPPTLKYTHTHTHIRAREFRPFPSMCSYFASTDTPLTLPRLLHTACKHPRVYTEEGERDIQRGRGEIQSTSCFLFPPPFDRSSLSRTGSPSPTPGGHFWIPRQIPRGYLFAFSITRRGNTQSARPAPPLINIRPLIDTR